MKVGDLIAQLQRLPIRYNVEARLSDAHIELNRAFAMDGQPIVLIEGNLKSGSAGELPSNVLPWVRTPGR